MYINHSYANDISSCLFCQGCPKPRFCGMLNCAVRQLINRGATIAIYTVNQGDDSDFLVRMQQDGLANGSSIRNDVIAIYISLQNRYSGIRFGDKWNAALATENNFEQIRTSQLN